MTLQFLGYALPGTVMFLFGVGWCWGHAAPRPPGPPLRGLHPALHGLHALHFGGKATTTTTTGRRLRCWPRLLLRHPVQGVLKLLVALVGLVGSLFAAYPDGSFQYVGDVPFATVYLFFALSGGVDVLACYCPHALGRGHRRAALALALLMEALLFHHAETAQQQHGYALQLLVGVMAACGATTALCGALGALGEAADAARCLCAVVHGSWLYHCGVLLYWPSVHSVHSAPPALMAASSPLWVTLSFSWHCAAAAALLIAFLVTRRSLCAAPRDRAPPPPPTSFSSSGHRGGGHHVGPRHGGAAPASPSPSPHHPCLLCSAANAASSLPSYHRGGSLV